MTRYRRMKQSDHEYGQSHCRGECPGPRFGHVTFVFRRVTLWCVEWQQLVSRSPTTSQVRSAVVGTSVIASSEGNPLVTWTCCGRLGLEHTDDSMMGIAKGAVIDGHQNGHRFGTYRPYRRRRHFLPRYASVLRPSSSDLAGPARDVDVRHFQVGSAVAKSNSKLGPMVVEWNLHGSNAHRL